MIEILNVKNIDKGYLKSMFDIKLLDINLCIYKMCEFQKNNNRWISFPTEVYEKNGEKKYFNLIKFENIEQSKKFQEEVIKKLDEFNKNNFDSEKKESLVQDDLPF